MTAMSIQDWYSPICFLHLLADETSEQHGLATRHRDRGMDAPLRNGWRQGCLIRVDDVRDLLLDLHLDRSIRIHVRQNLENYAGIAHLDRVDDRGVRDWIERWRPQSRSESPRRLEAAPADYP